MNSPLVSLLYLEEIKLRNLDCNIFSTPLSQSFISSQSMQLTFPSEINLYSWMLASNQWTQPNDDILF